MDGSPETTNVLLLWLVIVTALTPVMIAVAAVAVFVAWRRLNARVNDEIEPLLKQVHAVFGEVEHVSGLVRERLDRLDRSVASLERAGDLLTGRLGVAARRGARAVAGFLRSSVGPRPHETAGIAQPRNGE